MPDVDDVQDGKNYHLDVPMQANPFFLKGSNSLDWGMKNRLARIFNPATAYPRRIKRLHSSTELILR
jgi:3-hydroxy-5-phosphonooxypentane-2,4-dione thiolase